MLSCLRSIGLAARYVSGYLLTEPPPGQKRLIGADASHAWVSVYCPGSDGQTGSWIDADPTNGIFPDSSHITLGWGRDFLDVSPLRGVLIGGGRQTMQVAVTVAAAHERPGLPFEGSLLST
jgi:transglutaminase-like putative cysteine protease